MRTEYAYGADIGWLSQLEANGIKWVNEDMHEVDAIGELKRLGTNAIRLRVFVNPPVTAIWRKNETTVCMLGFCNAEGLLDAAKRVRDEGMRLMIDFHYSDHFADPDIQDIPDEWRTLSDEELHAAVHDHTTDILNLLKKNSIEPEWVQVGNEINHGLMWPRASLSEAPELMVALLNTGYDAVKEVFPECSVVTHLACLNDQRECDPFLNVFLTNGGKTDIFAFSFYPYWFNCPYDVSFIYAQMKYFRDRIKKPLLIAEVGGKESEPDQAYEIVRNTIAAGRLLPEGSVQGIFYWEPCAGGDFLSDHYPLGASKTVGPKTLQLTETLGAYRDAIKY